MKRNFFLLASVAALLLTACTSDSSLPNPTGKGTVRAINAIAGSPEIGFLIEESLVSIAGRPVPPVAYKDSTPPADYDDFSYNFSFQYASPGDTRVTRMATQSLKINVGQDHVLLLSGTLDAPTITVWTGETRTFDDSDTVLEVRFAHASATLGNVDVYFEDPAVVPGTNPPAATLAFGEIADAADFAEGSYVLTVTAAGDPGTVHYASREADLLPRIAHIMTIFDGDETDTAPVTVRSSTSLGNPLVLADANYPPQIRLVHGAGTLQAVDVYDDDLLTSLVVAGLNFKGATPYLDTTLDARTFYFTPVNSTATILFEQTIPALAPGTYADVILVGDTDAWAGLGVVPNRALTTNAAKIRIFQAAFNHDLLDVYLVDRDVPLDSDALLLVRNAAFALAAPTIFIPEGDIDLYITVAGEQTVVVGPYPVDATLNSTIDLLIVDTVDPLFAEIVDVTLP